MLTYQVAYALAVSEIIAEIRIAQLNLEWVSPADLHQCATLLVMDCSDCEKYWRLAERYLGR